MRRVGRVMKLKVSSQITATRRSIPDKVRPVQSVNHTSDVWLVTFDLAEAFRRPEIPQKKGSGTLDLLSKPCISKAPLRSTRNLKPLTLGCSLILAVLNRDYYWGGGGGGVL